MNKQIKSNSWKKTSYNKVFPFIINLPRSVRAHTGSRARARPAGAGSGTVTLSKRDRAACAGGLSARRTFYSLLQTSARRRRMADRARSFRNFYLGRRTAKIEKRRKKKKSATSVPLPLKL